MQNQIATRYNAYVFLRGRSLYMHRTPHLVLIVTTILLATATLMQSGAWCDKCQDEKTDECRDGTCQDVEYETHVEHEAFLHAPGNVDWGGGD